MRKWFSEFTRQHHPRLSTAAYTTLAASYSYAFVAHGFDVFYMFGAAAYAALASKG